MDQDIRKKFALGEGQAQIAEVWFKLMEFVAVTGVFHAAAEKTDLLGLIIMKWICYAHMFMWVTYKVDKVTWLLFPTTDPTNKKFNERHFAVSMTVASLLTALVGVILQQTIQVLLVVNPKG